MVKVIFRKQSITQEQTNGCWKYAFRKWSPIHHNLFTTESRILFTIQQSTVWWAFNTKITSLIKTTLHSWLLCYDYVLATCYFPSVLTGDCCFHCTVCL